MAILPLVMTAQGLQPAAPADLRNRLITLVAGANPDYTANLPGSLIEDIPSTDTFALVESDSFLVDLVNSVTTYGANALLLNQLGILYGVDQYVVIVGCGDPFQVAHAIWQADFYTPGLTGATLKIAGIINGNPTTIVTSNNHNLVTGDVEQFLGIVGGPSHLNFQQYPVTVTGDQTFTIPIDSTPWGPYQYGGTITPNPI